MNATKRKVRAYKIPRTQHHIGYRARSHWGDGDLLSPWAIGDVVDIPHDAPAFDRSLPHGWSDRPDLYKRPGRYVFTTAFSISEVDDWYFRVSPQREDGYTYDESSDRLHMSGDVNGTASFVLVSSADPENAREWPVVDPQEAKPK